MGGEDIMEFLALIRNLDGKNAGYIIFAVFFFILGKARFSWFVNLLLFLVTSGILVRWTCKLVGFGYRNTVWAGGLFFKALGFYVEERPVPVAAYGPPMQQPNGQLVMAPLQPIKRG